MDNYVDLSTNLIDKNKSTQLLADHIFSKKLSELNENELVSILMDDVNEKIDIFCALLEILLYGISKLSNNTCNIFDITNYLDDNIHVIKQYFKIMGVNANIVEEDINCEDILLYRDRDDYYCEILPKPPIYFCLKDWCILDYRLCLNKNFVLNNENNIESFSAFFISKSKKIYVLSFSLKITTF